ncbi:hypothetical protein U9M48_009306 [Paspalum notatum var. saurae]|uniref:HMA domain-containing protein n=1 Tax=Paspalum notatum var. saurae TaxID=547442 RepID=A0AAQ3SQZ7_PASNO
MGEEKKAGKDGGGGGDKKKEGGAPAGPQPIVLKVDLHCAGCASKVRKAIKRAPGVESVMTDMAAGKVVVSGPADAAELKERIEARAKKPVQIVSAGAGPPKKADKEEKKADGGGGEKKADKEKAGGEKKADKEKGGGDKKADKEKGAEKPKEPKQETVTLKIRLHCDGCIDRIRRRIYKIKGVKDVTVEAAKDLVKVTGTMDAAALPGYLRDKLSRDVEVVAAGKKDGGGGGDKKGEDGKDKGAGGDKKKDGGGGGDDKKEKDKDKSAAASASVAPTPMADAGMYQMPPHYGYTPYPPAPAGYYGAAAPPPHHHAGFYPNAAAGAQYPPAPPPTYLYSAHAPQMFSDENPNACSVM